MNLPTDTDVSNFALRVNRVTALIKRSTILWLEVATEVMQAKLALKATDYEEFLRQIYLTQAIANKLLKIADQSTLYSDRAKSHLSRVDGWTTLYEIAKLEPAQVTTFIDKLDSDPSMIVSREVIKQFAKVKNTAAAFPLVTIASIKVSQDDLLRLDFEQFLKVKDALDDIQRIVDRCTPAVSMNVASKELQRLEEMLVTAVTADSEAELNNKEMPILPAQIINNELFLSIT